ncbi:MAG: dihydroorotate dehydrogenase (quinone) [Thermonema sp.]|uniref:quinone-dependent dihydroorotate dehydrogenase n=1 Tax=Thermonema sp. TaxID=2231181 RepID=UPI0021DD48B5|nr:quinone-dependent dihydroorotate dehydrogenase [Thermonema sp.]GIV39320.1 MAG: dihydroorotate dehydrogenase (quinone) [Thermonema sp.]
MYSLIRRLLFLLPAEQAHLFTFSCLRVLMRLPFVKALCKRLFVVEDPRLEREYWGIRFRNPIGLAAGFDKNALLIDAWECFGFGFVEIGTVTPRPQAGNPRPRLFRLIQDRAIINRMGFNNDGVDAIVERLKKRKSNIVIGGNIGKNKTTPNERAVEDYVICFEKLFEYVDYFVVNVSSPNTPNLRALQEKEPLKQLLEELQRRNMAKPQPKPILLKIAPDLSEEQLKDVIEIVKHTGIAGIIATNTTIGRDGLRTPPEKVAAIGAGGLSGAPLRARSEEILQLLRKYAGDDFPIVSVGGLMTPGDVCRRLSAGADLVQLYTGFVYAGPTLVKRSLEQLLHEES